jgi:hypothetical protein
VPFDECKLPSSRRVLTLQAGGFLCRTLDEPLDGGRPGRRDRDSAKATLAKSWSNQRRRGLSDAITASRPRWFRSSPRSQSPRTSGSGSGGMTACVRFTHSSSARRSLRWSPKACADQAALDSNTRSRSVMDLDRIVSQPADSCMLAHADGALITGASTARALDAVAI